MCGRYVRKSTATELRDLFDLADLPEMPPHCNIAPTQQVLAVRVPETGQGREAAQFRWSVMLAYNFTAVISGGSEAGGRILNRDDHSRQSGNRRQRQEKLTIDSTQWQHGTGSAR